MQELAWLLEAKRNETQRLQEELVKECEGSHISLVEHNKILYEELGKQKADLDAALTGPPRSMSRTWKDGAQGSRH